MQSTTANVAGKKRTKRVNEVEALQNEIASLITENAKLDDRLSKCGTETRDTIDYFKHTVDETEQEVERLAQIMQTNEINAKKSAIIREMELNGKIEALEKEVETLQSDKKLLETQLENRDCTEKQIRLQKMESRMSLEDAKECVTKNELTSSVEAKTAMTSIDVDDWRIEEIRQKAKLKLDNQVIVKLKEEITVQWRRIENVESNLQIKSKENEKLMLENERLVKENASLRANEEKSFAMKDHGMQQIRKQLAEAEKANDKMLLQNATILKQLQEKNAELQNEIRNREQMIDQKEKELCNERHEHRLTKEIYEEQKRMLSQLQQHTKIIFSEQSGEFIEEVMMMVKR